MTSQSFFRALLCAALVVGLLTGCGAEKASFQSSSDVGYNPYPTAKLGECTRIPLQSGIQGQIGTYYEPSTRKYRADYINVNLLAVPADIFTSATLSITFLRWSEKTSGSRTTNQVPARFYFVDKLNGKTYPANSTADRINKATLEYARAYFGWSSAVTLQMFFQRASIVLTGIDMTYDAIGIALSDSNFGSSPYTQVNVLLPPFYASPVIYQSRMPVPSLYTLHPNYGYVNSGASENDFVQMISVICNELAGIGVRVPASDAKSDWAKSLASANADVKGAEARSVSSASTKADPNAPVGQRIWSRILESLDAAARAL